MGLGDLIRNLWEQPEWELPDENELTKEILKKLNHLI